MNVELRLEPCVLNLIGSEVQKTQKKRRQSNFGVKKFIAKNTQKKENFDV
jgi:hypothetical protein